MTILADVSSPRPYPYDALPRIGREEVRLLRRAVRWLPVGAPDAMLDAAEAVLGVRPMLEPTPLTRARAGKLVEALGDPIVAICVQDVGGPTSGFAVELDPSLGFSVVDRALGGEGGLSVGAATEAMGDAHRGVLAFTAAEIVAASGAAFRVSGVLTSRAALIAALGAGDAWVWPFRVHLGEERGALRVWIPASRLPAEPTASPWRDLRGLELRGSVVVGGGTLSPRELRDLAPGDAVIFERLSVSAPPCEGDARITFGAGLSVQCALSEGTLTCQQTLSVPERETRQGAKMTDPETTLTQEDALGGDDTLKSLSAAPIELTVELGRCSLSLGELSTLRVGEVILSGLPVGGAVTLRAGDRPIARGELVDVEGEVGVRVRELLG